MLTLTSSKPVPQVTVPARESNQIKCYFVSFKHCSKDIFLSLIIFRFRCLKHCDMIPNPNRITSLRRGYIMLSIMPTSPINYFIISNVQWDAI